MCSIVFLFNKNWFTTLLVNYMRYGVIFRLTLLLIVLIAMLHLCTPSHALTHKYDAHDVS